MSAVIPAEEPGLHVFYDTALCSLVGWANNFFVGREVAGIGEGYWGAGRASAFSSRIPNQKRYSVDGRKRARRRLHPLHPQQEALALVDAADAELV